MSLKNHEIESLKNNPSTCEKCKGIEAELLKEKKEKEQGKTKIQVLQSEISQLKGNITKLGFLLKNAQSDNDDLLNRMEAEKPKYDCDELIKVNFCQNLGKGTFDN